MKVEQMLLSKKPTKFMLNYSFCAASQFSPEFCISCVVLRKKCVDDAGKEYTNM